MSRTPEPRPALRRATDGSVHPAAPRATPEKHLHPAPVAPVAAVAPADNAHYKPGDLRARKAAKAAKSAKDARDLKSGKGKKAEDSVPLEVRVPKKLRKAVRKRAGVDGGSVDDVVRDALYSYLD
ncbi:MAG TPA: hypothetical protein VMT88_05010 [Actinomycetes bacterium]|nr:hypothetical protein [Actinomycetes bacterium]